MCKGTMDKAKGVGGVWNEGDRWEVEVGMAGESGGKMVNYN